MNNCVVYAKAPSTCRDYLTAGNEYLVRDEDGEGIFCITDDVGDEVICRWENDGHLRGGSWQRIEGPVVGLQTTPSSFKFEIVNVDIRDSAGDRVGSITPFDEVRAGVVVSHQFTLQEWKIFSKEVEKQFEAIGYA